MHKLRVFNLDNPDDSKAFDDMIGFDPNQVKCWAKVLNLGNAEVEYRYSCGHVIRDVIRDNNGFRDSALQL